MGACYYVKLAVKPIDQLGAINALNEHIKNDKHANYSLDKYAEQGIITNTFDDLMRIFLAGWENQKVDINISSNFTTYENEFNASYGWETVMIDMFHTLAPFVMDGSKLLIYPDSDYDELIVKNGMCVCLH